VPAPPLPISEGAPLSNRESVHISERDQVGDHPSPTGVPDKSSRLTEAYHSQGRVLGRTHGLYRYPARFAPEFVRAAIESFTKPGDLVVDPFVGGGTSAVETLALGRRFAGFDINPISTLLTSVKTTPLYRRDVAALERWLGAASRETWPAQAPDDPRLTNAPEDLLRALSPFVTTIASLGSARQQAAARAVVLDAAQRAIDGRAQSMPGSHVPELIQASLQSLVEGVKDLMDAVREDGRRPSSLLNHRVIRCGDVSMVARSRGTNRLSGRAALVVTSPPYPGVHVLYHRWQVGGRSETPLPYWIADQNDGLGPKHYTMGGRSLIGVDRYFRLVEEAWTSVQRLLRPGALVVQLVAFTDVTSQMPRYLEAMHRAGFARAEDLEPDSWRVVPNRRWYYRVDPRREQARETLLVHRLERGPQASKPTSAAPSAAAISSSLSAPSASIIGRSIGARASDDALTKS
jgi:DNA modification methylase